VAEIIRLAAENPGTRIVNAGDPTAPTVREIASAVDAVLGHEAVDVLVDGLPDGDLGSSPWSGPLPVVLDMGLAERDLGYVPVTGYAESLPETIEWMLREVDGREWQEAFPLLNRVLSPLAFDYDAEDRWLASQ
jgi:nucleoside-diphosphate-sugar epimerase